MEIERKFIVPEDFKERLEEQGFNLVKEFEEVLQDKYYDTNEHHLLHMVKYFNL
jgi:inorganic triphosphatase YgiF